MTEYAVLRRAEAALSAGRIADAEREARAALDLAPKNPICWAFWCLVRDRMGDHPGALTARDHALSLAQGVDAQTQGQVCAVLLRLGTQAMAARAWGHARDYLDGVLRLDPAHLEARARRGAAASRMGAFEAALADFEAALTHAPGSADLAARRAGALVDLGRLDDADRALAAIGAPTPAAVSAWHRLAVARLGAGSFRGALGIAERLQAHHPGDVRFLHVGAAAHARAGAWGQAEAWYRRALSAAPADTTIKRQLIAVLHEQGRLDAARPLLRECLRDRPVPAESLEAVGDHRLLAGKPRGARLWLKRALARDPGRAEAMLALARERFQRGLEGLGLELVLAVLDRRPDLDAAWPLLEFAVETLRGPDVRPDLYDHIRAGVDAGRLSPSAVLRPALDLIRARPADRGTAGADADAAPGWIRDPLLLALMTRVVISDPAFEREVTRCRRALLSAALDGAGPALADWPLEVLSALAIQCFLTEFVYDLDPEEGTALDQLRRRVAARLAGGDAGPAPALAASVLVLACYGPLLDTGFAPELARRDWPAPVDAVITIQIREPEAERALRPRISRLTAIDDAVSRAVRAGYEDNPYPRWRTAPVAPPPVSPRAHVERHFPHAPVLEPTPAHGRHRALVAGCGTGWHAILTARHLAETDVTAIDVSLASLAYARRATEALGLSNLTYAQADILRIKELGQTFDVIEAVGVLHHMAQPFDAWRGLLEVLTPGGFMVLGLYSRAARQGILAARAEIRRLGFGVSAEEIRRCRRHFRAHAAQGDGPRFLTAPDFFSMSGVRDLLMHVQETQFTLVEIEDFITTMDLNFIGFDINPKIKSEYFRQYPDDVAATSLAKWHDFETRHPYLFGQMYQFWVQKRG